MRAHAEALAFIWRWLCSPEAPPTPQRLRWRRLHHHPGDSWGWWRRWWTLPAPQSQPLWCWCRSRRAAAIGSTASCRARPWEGKGQEEKKEAGFLYTEAHVAAHPEVQHLQQACGSGRPAHTSHVTAAGLSERSTYRLYRGRNIEGCLHQSHPKPGGRGW